ncbi:putative Vitamin B12 import system, periplasmic binding protein BtuF [Nitrospina gracilis 3/211]|uniref:Putative Vitamin B12 import system, periplasmic binding protein BtuF n=1 Tax=Nitrospina gracilis (strain 3/211) TaxID=1266370 RepID=M1Z1B5_NITG3|nr:MULTISPECIES: ABC transporter substrate-binding protein [Nitrospina]MCF8724148.1 iron complex transport system substrate-binding protein [Nitrospina sp. Nb-3]CCQ91294.1 putative Vitamin B12 import system, periplasmic binding protein BtuF [Nitrospina gracilis 3/211]
MTARPAINRFPKPSLYSKPATFGSYFRSVCAALCLLALLAVPLSSWAVEPGNAPQRIISMSPSITEFLFELGVGDRVVGVTNFCKYPPEACARTKIGSLLHPSIERWITLNPDLVIHQATSHTLKNNAVNLHIRTLAVEMQTLEQIYESLHKMGKALHIEDRAKELIHRLKSGIDAYRQKLKGHAPKSTLLILGDSNEPGRSLYAVGPSSFLGELLELAGGKNIVTDTIAPYPKINKEYIIQQSPQVIIEAGPAMNMTAEEKAARLKEWRRFSTIRAVSENNIHFISADYILIPGPRLLSILDDFARALHPEVFGPSNETSSTGGQG